MAHFVEFSHITREYRMGDTRILALDDISFTLDRGHFYVILGQSGAGKTTVLNLLGGMDKATGGALLVDGEDVTAMSERELTFYRRNKIGFVFQFYNLVPNLTALENVELAKEICKSLWIPGTLWKKSVWPSAWIISRPSFPAENSSGSPLPGLWRKTRIFYCATSPPARWILKPGKWCSP